MKYGFKVKDTVRNLRKNGSSLLEIHRVTKVPVTTITTWIKDIILSDEQKAFLKQKVQKALQAGRIRVQGKAKKNRIEKLNKYYEEGKKEIGVLSKRELFLSGVALYWGEGFKNKHEHRLGFCNSDLEMILFYIQWLEICFGITKNALVLRLSINSSYKKTENAIKKYWSAKLNIPIGQFTKTFYQNVRWKKQYTTNNYYGVLRVHVKDSLHLLWKMKGWLEGLKMVKYASLPG